MSEAGRLEYLQKIRAVEGYEKNRDQVEPNSWGTPSVLLPGQVPQLGNTTYPIPAIMRWPERIILPPGNDRTAFNEMASGYAQNNMGNTDVFGVLSPSRFEVLALGVLRTDFIFYLEELQSLVCPKMGIEKLVITSSFRTQEQQNFEYRDNKDGVPSSAHMGGVAVDISALNDNRYIIADTAHYMNFGGIAVGERFVHLDIGPYGRWAYNGTPQYNDPSKKYG